MIGPSSLKLGGNMAFEVIGHRLYVVTGVNRFFEIFDITDIKNPLLLAFKEVKGPANTPVEIEINQNRGLAFVSVAGEHEGLLSIFDINDFAP